MNFFSKHKYKSYKKVKTTMTDIYTKIRRAIYMIKGTNYNIESINSMVTKLISLH